MAELGDAPKTGAFVIIGADGLDVTKGARMGWLGRMADRYEEWRVKAENELVRDVLRIQAEADMEKRGVFVAKDEKEDGGVG